MGPPRLKSELWVQAFLRSNEITGRNGAVIRKGAAEAGAVCVIINHLDGAHTLLEPAPGSSIDEAGDRRFVATLSKVDWPTIAQRMERVRKVDADAWFIEADDREGLAGLKLAGD